MKNTWFTVETIDENTFALSEYGHWEETHSYLLCGAHTALLIDTGLGVADIRAQVEQLTKLPVVATCTHAHWDHIGGHGAFKHIAVHEAEQTWLDGQFPLPTAVVRQNLLRESCDFPRDFDPQNYTVFQGVPDQILHDGDEIDLGGRRVCVLHTPGHSPGHCCFYEAEKRRVYAGDLIYAGCLDAFYPTTDPVAFYHSIRRIGALQPREILPGHHRLRIAANLVDRIANGFEELARSGRLRQSEGIFEFGEFSIHI